MQNTARRQSTVNHHWHRHICWWRHRFRCPCHMSNWFASVHLQIEAVSGPSLGVEFSFENFFPVSIFSVISRYIESRLGSKKFRFRPLNIMKNGQGFEDGRPNFLFSLSGLLSGIGQTNNRHVGLFKFRTIWLIQAKFERSRRENRARNCQKNPHPNAGHLLLQRVMDTCESIFCRY